MSDYAAFLSHNPHRNIPWVGHPDFPKRTVKYARNLAERYSSIGYELRIFELSWTMRNEPLYHLLSEEDVASYME